MRNRKSVSGGDRRRPSAAMIIAMVALSAALAGTAIAGPEALVSKITKSKVKKIAKKEANKRINKRESGLDVNSAKTANTATMATSADSFAEMTAERFEAFTLNNGQSQALGTFGPFTLTASCEINVGGFDRALVEIETSQDNSAFRGEDSSADFDVGQKLEYVAAVASPTTIPDLAEDGGVAIAPDGTELIGYRLYAGVNVLDETGKCRFGGALFTG